MSTHWYAVQTKPRQEAEAQVQLERQGYTVYLPTIVVRKRRRDTWVQVTEPLFPRYLFLRADVEAQSLAPVRSTIGVAELVRFGKLLRAVPDSVVSYLQRAEDELRSSVLELGDTDWPFQPGDVVEVLEGAFKGLPAVFQQTQPEARALILIELLGRDNSISVPMDTINVR